MKTLIFDLGNVLVFFDIKKMFGQIAACTGLDTSVVKALLIEHQRLYEQGSLSNQELVQSFQKKSTKSFTEKEFFEAASDIFRPNEPMLPLLTELKKRYRLVLLSNTSRAHFEFLLPRYPILKLFDEFVLSYQVGAAKPDPKIYAAAIRAAKCPPQECFYTDDIEEYVLAARSHGIHSEVFTDAKRLIALIPKAFI